jgi:hypothetical protein
MIAHPQPEGKDRPETLNELATRLAGSISDLLPPDSPWLPSPEWVASIIQRPNRCSDCTRPLSAARSIAARRGPRCSAKRRS